MTNRIEEIGEDIALAGKAVARHLTAAFSVAEKAGKVLETMVREESALKPVLISATEQAVSIAASIAKVEQEKGLNWADDTALLAQVQAYFKTTIEGMLVPAVEKAYGDLKTDVAA